MQHVERGHYHPQRLHSYDRMKNAYLTHYHDAYSMEEPHGGFHRAGGTEYQREFLGDFHPYYYGSPVANRPPPIQRPNYGAQEISNPLIHRTNYGAREISNPLIQQPYYGAREISDPLIQQPYYGAREISNPPIQQPYHVAPEISNPPIQRPYYGAQDISNPPIQQPYHVVPEISNPPIQQPLYGTQKMSNPRIQQPYHREPEANISYHPYQPPWSPPVVEPAAPRAPLALETVRFSRHTPPPIPWVAMKSSDRHQPKKKALTSATPPTLASASPKSPKHRKPRRLALAPPLPPVVVAGFTKQQSEQFYVGPQDVHYSAFAPEKTKGKRRKVPPLKWWLGERCEYKRGKGDMPRLTYIVKVDQTTDRRLSHHEKIPLVEELPVPSKVAKWKAVTQTRQENPVGRALELVGDVFESEEGGFSSDSTWEAVAASSTESLVFLQQSEEMVDVSLESDSEVGSLFRDAEEDESPMRPLLATDMAALLTGMGPHRVRVFRSYSDIHYVHNEEYAAGLLFRNAVFTSVLVRLSPGEMCRDVSSNRFQLTLLSGSEVTLEQTPSAVLRHANRVAMVSGEPVDVTSGWTYELVNHSVCDMAHVMAVITDEDWISDL